MTLKQIHASLGIGIAVLAEHPGRINERLIAAFHKELHLIQAEDLDVPGLNLEAGSYWRQIVTAVTAHHDEQRGSYEPSIEALSEEKASQIARMIVGVESMLSFTLIDRR